MTSRPHSPADALWNRPVPTIGDTSSAHERASDPAGWAFSAEAIAQLGQIIASRRDIRRYRPDPVPNDLVRAVIEAGHLGPSVGHSQPWRFIVVSDPSLRDRAAAMSDSLRLRQAAAFSSDRAQRLLDLKLEGLREAPLGIVVACDRRVPAAGVLGRATFPDTDLWSCACAIENMWLTARAHGLGMGWVTLFEPRDLEELLELPEHVETLGWLCLGWPDERPPEPGLQRLAWSSRLPLDEVILRNRWPGGAGGTDGTGLGAPSPREAPAPPPNHLRAPDQARVVAATDDTDDLLSPPGSLGALDRVLDTLVAAGCADATGGTLVLAGADHPVAALGVSAYPARVTRDVMKASVAGQALGVVTASGAGLGAVVVDAGVSGGPLPGAVEARLADGAQGDLMGSDALTREAAERLIERGRQIGRRAAPGIVALGEVGVGNTTVAAALACALLNVRPEEAVGLGAGSDAAILERKREVVSAALERVTAQGRLDLRDPVDLLAGLGGPEVAVLVGVVLGAASAGTSVVLDGLATSVAGLLAQRLEPAVHAYLVAGQRSREVAHDLVLQELGLEPLLVLRLRAGEGVGACLATSLLLQGLRLRHLAARTR
ncbi:MAG: 5,6-dimethylbenzimidazole synthase [Dermatophilaceae bacterium]